MIDDKYIPLKPLRQEFTADVIKFLLDYNPKNGEFKWRVHIGGRVVRGKRAGCATTHSKGYGVIKICGVRFLTHRLAFLIMTGSWPTSLIDHKDGNKQNNSWDNIRSANHSQNMANCKVRKDNSYGKGVYLNRHKKFCASICFNGKRKWLGVFNTKEEAQFAYDKAANKIHGEFKRGKI